jgi:Secretion system C-terminal sorting domain
MHNIYLGIQQKFIYFLKLATALLLLMLGNAKNGFSQATNPTPYDLSLGTLIRTGLNAAVSSYPQNIQGWTSGTNNLVVPPGNNIASPLADEPLVVNGSASTPGLSNLGIDGYNFLSTSSSPNQQVGAIAVSLNTSNRGSLLVTWTAEDLTNAANSREMNLTLQYRIGTTGDFTPISGSTYTTNNFNKKAAATFSNVLLPNVCNNKPVVQLRWIYFESANQTGVGSDAIRLDDIYVSSSIAAACTPPTTQSTIGGYLTTLNNTIEPVIVNGNGQGHIIVFKFGNAGVTGTPVDGTDYSIGASSDFSQSTATIAAGEKVVYVGTGSVLVTGLAPNSTYSVNVFEYSNTFCYSSGNGGTQQTFNCNSPSTGVSNLSTSLITTNTATLNWTNGNGTNRLVILNAATQVTGSPVAGTSYTANSDYTLAPTFTPGTGKIVYKGTGSSVNLTGLANNTTYYAQVFEYRAPTNCYASAASINFSTGTTSFTAFDNFDRIDNIIVGIPSSMGLTPPAWTEFENAATNATIVSNALQLTSCLTGTCATGKEAISYDMTPQYATTFASVNTTLQWHFNMKQNRTGGNLSGFGNGDYGMAMIIGSNEADIRSATADGYAVIMGETGAADPIRLVHFTNGIANYTSIIDVPSPSTKTNYMSVRVTYNPCTSQWGLLVRDDGAVAFQDPLTITGVEVNASNTTYTTTALNYLGALWNHATTNNEEVFFDNISIPTGLGTTNTYVWNASVSTDYQIPNNWTPARTCLKINDVLVFDATSPATSIVTNVPTQTIGKLLVSGNRFVSFKDNVADAVTNTITIGGGTGDDFVVQAGSIFNFDVASTTGTNALVVSLLTSTTADISGVVNFDNTFSGTQRAHQLIAADANAILVKNGGIVRATNLSGNPFGSTGIANVVVFQSGSIYESADGGHPFGLGQPASKVIFQTGSLYRHLQGGATPPSIAGRTYANFEFDFAAGTNITLGSAAAMTADNFRVKTGVLNITAATQNINIKGDLLVDAGATFNYSTTAASTIAFTSTNAIQKINSAGTLTFGRFATIELNNTNTTPRLDVETNIRIQGTLKITAGNLNLSTGDVTIQSDATSTANITPVNGTVTYGTGRFSIERFLFAQKSWRFLATPVERFQYDASSPTITNSWREGTLGVPAPLTSTTYGTRLTGPTGMDEYTQRSSMKSYNMAGNNYAEINNAKLNDTIANDAGYFVFVRGDRGIPVPSAAAPTTLRIKGKIRTGNQTFNVNAGSFQSFGNPFASAIDFRLVTKNTIVDAYTAWNPAIAGSYNVGGYENYVYDGIAHYKKIPGGQIRDSIQSGEAVFIQSTTLGSVVIKEADKVNGSRLVSRAGSSERLGETKPTLEINLYTKNTDGSNLLADGVMLNFDNSFSNAVDNLDVRKINNTYDNMAVKTNANTLVVERRMLPTIADTIFLNLSSTRVAAYRFDINPLVLSNTGLEAFLKDKFLQIETAISLQEVTNITFDITTNAASKAVDRFMIVFKPAATTNFTTIAATRNADKTIIVNWGVQNETAVTNYSVEQSNDGVNFTSIATKAAQANNGTNPTYSAIDATATKAANWYRVKANNTNNTVKYTAVAMVAAVQEVVINEVSKMSIYPNPVVDGNVNLHLDNQAKGNYAVQITNAEGKTINVENVQVQNNNTLRIIKLGTKATGTYQLTIKDAAGKKKTIPFIVK